MMENDQQWWEKKYGRPAEHTSSVRATEDGGLIDTQGNKLMPGDPIKLHFAGGPADMPEPWSLVKARNYFSTVNWQLNPEVTVRAANGIECTFRNANYYSPCLQLENLRAAQTREAQQ